jgi:hypothetical protein
MDTDTLPNFTVDYRWTPALERDTRVATGRDVPATSTRTPGWLITCREHGHGVAFVRGKTGTLADAAARAVEVLTAAHGPSVAGRTRHTVAGSTAEFRAEVGTATELRLMQTV